MGKTEGVLNNKQEGGEQLWFLVFDDGFGVVSAPLGELTFLQQRSKGWGQGLVHHFLHLFLLRKYTSILIVELWFCLGPHLFHYGANLLHLLCLPPCCCHFLSWWCLISIPASGPLAQYMESASQLETSWVFPNQRLQTSITCQLHLHWQIDPGVLSLSLLLSLSSFFLFMVFTIYRLLLVIADSRIQWY